MMEEPLIAISVLNWNGWQDTLECLQSIRLLEYSKYLTIVVDNGSSDDSVEKIREWAEANLGPGHAVAEYSREIALAGGIPELEKALDLAPCPARMVLIRNEENLGFTGGNNVSIHYALQRAAAAGYVFLLNNDAEPDPRCLTRLVQVDRETNAGILGAVILSEDGRVRFAKSGPLLSWFFAPLIDSQEPMPSGNEPYWDSLFAEGSAMLIRKDVLGSVLSPEREYLDSRLFMYWDEINFCNLAREKGFRCIVARNALVRHHGARSAGGYKAPAYYYYFGRNRIRTAVALLPPGWRILFHLVHTPMRLASAANNARAGRFASARAILSGLIDGYRGTTGKWKYHDQEVRKDGAS